MFMHPLHTQTNMWSPQNLLKLSFGVLMQEMSCFRNVCWWFQPVSLVGCVSGYFTHGFVTRRLAIYRNTHSLSGLCQNSITTCFYLLFSMAIKSSQEAVGMLELVTCGGEGEEGAQLWVPWEQLGALGWLAAPSSLEPRTSCMAAGPYVGDGKATCPRHWAPGVQIGWLKKG